MKEYLVSVAIATRNRSYYMLKVFEQLYQLGDNVQIVISDNSDTDILRNKIKNYIDGERVKYIYTPQKVSVVQNYDITAQNATGKYYICIGDDDLVLANIIRVCHWMEKNNIDAVKTSREITYIWPGASSRNGRISITHISKNKYYFDGEQGVISVLKQGCQDYLTSNMVGSYHAVVSMKRMREVQDLTGVYFGGFSPDIYSATCLSLLPNMKCVYLDFPVSIPGSCAYSASNRSSKKTAVSSVEEAIKAYGSETYQWGEQIPNYYTPETTWAETMLKAIKAMKRDDLLVYFNRTELVNCVYHRWKDYRNEINNALTQEEKELISYDKNYAALHKNYSYVYKLKRRFSGEVKDFFFVRDNHVAKKKIDRYLKRKLK